MRLKLIWPSTVALTLSLAACVADSRDHNREFLAFGTVVSLSLYDVDGARAASTFALIEDEYQTLERDWYPWQPGELQRINTAIAAGDAINVSEPLAEAIRLAAHYETLSRGRFSAGLGRLSEIWGMQPVLKSLDAAPDAAVVSAALLNETTAEALTWDGNTLFAKN